MCSSLISRPAVVCLVVTLIAMLLERVLRLITEMAAVGAHLSFLPQIVVTLVPYYLGQALPASFFVALFMVISRLDDGNEIDPMLASGRSLSRVTMPLVLLGVGAWRGQPAAGRLRRALRPLRLPLGAQRRDQRRLDRPASGPGLRHRRRHHRRAPTG